MLAPRGPDANVVVASVGAGELPDVVDHDVDALSTPTTTATTTTTLPSRVTTAVAHDDSEDERRLDVLRRLYVVPPPLRAFVRYAQTPASTADDDLATLFAIESEGDGRVGAGDDSDNEQEGDGDDALHDGDASKRPLPRDCG